MCVYVLASLLLWTYQPESHRRFALFFLARRIQPFLSFVDREVDFCVTKNRSLLVGQGKISVSYVDSNRNKQ